MTRREWFWSIVRWGTVAVVLVFVGHQLHSRWSEAQHQPFSLHWGWLAVSGASYLAAWLPAAFWWRRVMQAGGERPPLGAVLRAYHVGHLGKYVPGKAMVIVIRSGMIRAAGGRPQVAALAVVYETLGTMLAGSLLAGVLLLWQRDVRDDRWLALSGLFAVICALPLAPPLFRLAMKLMARDQPMTLAPIPARAWVGWLALLSLGWWLSGLSLGMAILALGDVPGGAGTSFVQQWPQWTLRGALAMVAGFVVVWFPAGFGVREGVLVELLQPTLGPKAVAVAVVWRLTTILSEAVLGAVLYFIPKWRGDVGQAPRA